MKRAFAIQLFCVVSMEFICSFLRRHFAWKLVLAVFSGYTNSNTDSSLFFCSERQQAIFSTGKTVTDAVPCKLSSYFPLYHELLSVLQFYSPDNEGVNKGVIMNISFCFKTQEETRRAADDAGYKEVRSVLETDSLDTHRLK